MTYSTEQVAKALQGLGIKLRYFPYTRKFTVDNAIPEMTNGGDEIMIKLHTPVAIDGYAYPLISTRDAKSSKRMHISGDVRVLIYNQRTQQFQANIHTQNGKEVLVKGLSCSQTIERQNSQLECIAADSKDSELVAQAAGDRAPHLDQEKKEFSEFGVAALPLYNH